MIQRLINWIRKRKPCFAREHDWVGHMAYDTEPHVVGRRIGVMYGGKCRRCGHFQPIGYRPVRTMSVEEHMEYSLHGKMPKVLLCE